jgi:hypothetical protein
MSQELAVPVWQRQDAGERLTCSDTSPPQGVSHVHETITLKAMSFFGLDQTLDIDVSNASCAIAWSAMRDGTEDWRARPAA